MLLEFFPMDHTLQICLHTKPSANVPICLKYTQFKPSVFSFVVFQCSSTVWQGAHVECSHLAAFVEQILLCIISVIGWRVELVGRDSFRETHNSSNFQAQRWLGKYRLTLSFINIHIWKCMLMLAFGKLCDKLPASSTWLLNSLCTLVLVLCIFKWPLLSKKLSFLPHI